MSNNNLVDQIKGRLSLLDVVGRTVELRRRGRRHWGPCPFHGEKTASFAVKDDKWYCFGCKAHGDVIDFMAKLSGKTNADMIKQLAAEFGLEGQKPQRPPPREPLTALTPLAEVPEAELPWLRSQRKAEFEALVMRHQAALQRVGALTRRIGARTPTDAEWKLLEAAHGAMTRVEADIDAFWRQGGFMPRQDFLAAYLAASTVDDEIGVTDADMLVHLKRPAGAATGERYDAEWLPCCVAPTRAVVEIAREASAKGPIMADEVARVRAWRRANDPRYAARITGITEA